MGQRVMLDTDIWIYLKNDSEKLSEFQRKVEENDVEVLFSAGNFIDLLKAEEQDRLSEIIAESVDQYIPLQSKEGREYLISEEPASLIPSPADRQEFVRQTHILDDDLALRYLFRTADWENPEVYLEITETMRDVHDKFGFENAMGYVFEDYLEDHGDSLLLHQEDVQPIEFIRNMFELHRIEQMKDGEKPDGNDFADMAICSHAVLTDCDSLFIERKWIDQGVIESVVERLTLDGPTLYSDYDTFLSEFHVEQAGSGEGRKS
jgi:predicted nucleic acid-binding protein